MFFLLALGNSSREASSRQSRAHGWLASGRWCFKTQSIFTWCSFIYKLSRSWQAKFKTQTWRKRRGERDPQNSAHPLRKIVALPFSFFSLLPPEWLWFACLKSGRLWTVSHSSKSVKQNVEQKGMVWPNPLTRKKKETTALTVLKSDEFFLHNIDCGHDNLSYYISERSEITLTLHCSAKRWVIKCWSYPSICFFSHNFRFLHNRIKTRMEVHFYII